MKNNSKIIGLIALIAVVAIIIGGVVWKKTRPVETPTTTITGYLGGEKADLFDDPGFQKLTSEESHVKFEYRKAGSLDMATADKTNMDYAFPSSAIALDYYKDKNGGKAGKRSDSVFNSPIVVYTHKSVAEALAKHGITSKQQDGFWRIDMTKAVEALTNGTKWTDLGVDGVYGDFRIDSSDPTKSNSGNVWSALLATVMNGGQAPTAETVARDLPKLKAIFAKSGYMNSSSEDVFDQFLVQGVGSKPMSVGYESQLLDLAKNNADQYKQVKDDIIILYPTPTMWSTHEYIALDDNGAKGLDALRTKAVQEYAWKQHGFRTNNGSGSGDVKEFGVNGILQNVPNVAPTPDYTAMKAIINGLGGNA